MENAAPPRNTWSTRDLTFPGCPASPPNRPTSQPLGRRILRWARGSGSSVQDVQLMLEEYKRLAKVFSSTCARVARLGRRGSPGLPRMGPLPATAACHADWRVVSLVAPAVYVMFVRASGPSDVCTPLVPLLVFRPGPHSPSPTLCTLSPAAAMKGMKIPKNLKGDMNPRNMQVGAGGSLLSSCKEWWSRRGWDEVLSGPAAEPWVHASNPSPHPTPARPTSLR